MSLPRSVAEILREHVTLEIEGIDRMYLNVYVPQLQREGGVATQNGDKTRTIEAQPERATTLIH
jgi:hypothetical protein